MIDFPNSPTPGQIFNSGTGPIYVWDGVAWTVSTAQTKTALARNHIVNPAMQHSQENGTVSVSANSSYPADQWRFDFGGPPAPSAALTVGAGFPNFLRMWSGTGGFPTPAAGSLALFLQPFEGAAIGDFNWGTPNAIPAVLRFKARSSAAPFTFAAAVRSRNTDRSFAKNFVATASFQDFVMPIPPCPDGSWAIDNTLAGSISFAGMMGSTLTAPAGGVWQNGNYGAAPGIGNLFSVASQSLDIADVGLYADPLNTGLPPPFEKPDYGAELPRCLRFLQYAPVSIMHFPYINGAGQFLQTFPFQTAMRVTPTVSYISVSYANASGLSTNAVAPTYLTPQATAVAAGSGYVGFTAILNARF